MSNLLDLKSALNQLPTETGIHRLVPGFDIVVHVLNADLVEAGTLWDVKDLAHQTIYRIRRQVSCLEVEIIKATDCFNTKRVSLNSQTVRDAVLEIMDHYIL